MTGQVVCLTVWLRICLYISPFVSLTAYLNERVLCDT